MPYKTWLCIVCDFIYNEEKGLPEEGLAPGTRWADVPDDWACPDCGVGKVDFDMVEIASATGSESPSTIETALEVKLPPIKEFMPPLVIIGSGLAGYHLAREFRKHDQTRPLTIITADDGSLYSKPQLSTGFSKNKTPEQLVTATSESMAQELRASIRTFTTVSRIDAAKNQLIIDGAKLSYSQLVFATGAECFRLNVAGNAQADIFDVNSLQDYSRFRTALVNKKRVLIIGAGLIGSEYANDLIKSGYQVVVVNRESSPLTPLLPEQISMELQATLEQAGVQYYQDIAIKSVNRCGTNVLVELTDGQVIETDIILSAIGLKPRTELAASAGIKINRGIVTNRLLQTSVENIYALGDCAEVDGRVLCYIAPLMACTKKLAKTLAGTSSLVHYDVMPVLVKTSLLPLLISAAPLQAVGHWQVSGEGKNLSARFTSPDGRLLGFVLSGELVNKKHLIPEELVPIMTLGD